MDRKEFAEILNSIKISEGCDDKILQQEMLPISHAILQMMPNRLFRYRSCSDASVEAFVNDKIYEVTADLFNDTYDTLLRFDKDAVKQMFKSLLSKDIFNRFRAALLQGIDFPDIVKQNFSKEYIAQTREYILSLAKEEDIETLILSRRKEINNIVDLLFPLLVNYVNKRTSTISCFSETIESVTMWSHYANYHKGFALEYNLRDTLLNSIPNVGIFPVIYDNKRYDGTYFVECFLGRHMGLFSKLEDVAFHTKAALYKSPQW